MSPSSRSARPDDVHLELSDVEPIKSSGSDMQPGRWMEMGCVAQTWAGTSYSDPQIDRNGFQWGSVLLIWGGLYWVYKLLASARAKEGGLYIDSSNRRYNRVTFHFGSEERPVHPVCLGSMDGHGLPIKRL